MLTTFAFVTFAWIFFRADGMGFALSYIKQVVLSLIAHPGQFLMLPGGKRVFVYIIPLILGDWYLRRDERNFKKWPLDSLIVFVLAGILLWKLTSQDGSLNFIYFQF